jgi:HK97 family phage prohead protease
MTAYRIANEQMGMEYRDVWTTAYVNDLPDSAFLYIAPGGTKDSDGKTVPRSLRYFPVKDANGKVDEPHVANALARIPQASSLSPDVRAAAMAKAKALAAKTNVSGPPGTYAGSAGSGRSAPLEVLTRSFSVDLMLRAGGDGRTLVGRAVPYGQTIDIDTGRERFLPGAFNRQIESNQVASIKLHATHEGRRTDFAVGKTLSLEDRQDGLHGTWGLYETPRGDEALYMVRTGEVTGLSVGFKAVAGGTRLAPDGTLERAAVHLDHVALTTEPAYSEAKVLAIRSVDATTVSRLRTERERHHGLIERLRV